MRLEALEDDLLARHQKKLRFKQLEDQLNEENQLILDLIKLYEEVSHLVKVITHSVM